MKFLNVACSVGWALTAATVSAAAAAQTPAEAPPPAPPPSAAPGSEQSPPATGEVPPPPPPSETTVSSAPAAPPSEAAPPPPPPIYVETPPPPPPAPRTRHYHDGFYARFSLGAGWLWAHSDTEDTYDVTAKGWGYTLDVMLGGTLRPGLVIGGGLLLQDALEPDVSASANTPEVVADVDQLSLGLIGAMIDGFPDPDGGFHVGGLLGIAVLPGFDDDDGNAPSGFGVAAWVGYQWWTSSEFSLGGMLRLATTRTSGSSGANDGLDSVQTARALTLMFTALYH